MVTKAGIAAELLNQNDFEEVMVFVVIPPLNPSSSIPETKRCTAIFECSDRYHPNTKGWGYECEVESFVDPTDDIDVENVIGKRVLWKTE